MLKRIKYVLIFILMLLPINVFAKADVYDVILFFGQSNMTGYAGIYDNEKNVDVRLNNIGIDSFSQKTGINKSILNNYTKMNHVNVSISDNCLYEYVYETNSLREITSSTTTLGENLKWNSSTNKFDTVERQTYFASQESYGTNMIPQFAQTYYKATGRKVIAVMVSNGGEEIAHFLPHDQVATYSSSTDAEAKNQYIYEAMKAKYNAAIAYLNGHSSQYKIGKKLYIIFQGESDASNIASGSLDADGYYSIFKKVHNKLVSDLGIQYGGIVETGGRPGIANSVAINKLNTAQAKLVSENSDIFLASSYPYDHYVPDEGHYQGSDYASALENAKLSMCIVDNENNSIHFNSAALSQIGLESAQNAVKYLNDNNKWLTSLSVGGKSLTIGNSTTFSLEVDEDVDSVSIAATTLHTGITFVSGYGPRDVDLEDDETTILLKVSDGNTTKTYTIVVSKNKEESPEDDPEDDTPTGDDKKEEVVEVPDTGLYRSRVLIVISIITIVSGLAICIYNTKLTKKDE